MFRGQREERCVTGSGAWAPSREVSASDVKPYSAARANARGDGERNRSFFRPAPGRFRATSRGRTPHLHVRTPRRSDVLAEDTDHV